MCRTKKSTLLTSLPLRLMSAHTVCGQYLKFISSQPIHLYSSWSFCSSFLSLGVSSVTEHSAQTLFNTVILSLSFLMTLYCQNLYFFPKVFFFWKDGPIAFWVWRLGVLLSTVFWKIWYKLLMMDWTTFAVMAVMVMVLGLLAETMVHHSW